MGSKLRNIGRKQRSAAEATYVRTYNELGRAAVAWIDANREKTVIFSFPKEVAMFGLIGELPPECIHNDGAREFWEHCSAHCPEATILMLEKLVEQVAKAAGDDAISYDSDTVGRS